MSAAVMDDTAVDSYGVVALGASAATAAAARVLEPRIAEVCGQLNVLHAEPSRLVADADTSGAWQGHGIRSLSQWVGWQTGLAAANVRQLVTLAAARATHPRIVDSFDDGLLSLDQAALAVECEPGDDATFADLATVLTIPQLRTALRAANPPAAKATAEQRESVTMGPDRYGMWDVRVRLHLDRGAEVEAALAAIRDDLYHQDDTGEVTWAEAVVELARRGLDSLTATRRQRFRINLFVDFDPHSTEPTTTWSDGARVPDAIRDLLACDGDITPIVRIGGYPVNVGHNQRIVPDRTRRLVEHRDRKCRVPWCPNHRWLQIHHIIHWTGDHGPTETWNLAALCAACHRQHHLGELGISGNADLPDGLTFTDRHGNTIDPATRPTKPTGPPPQPRHRYRHPHGGHLQRDALLFNPQRRTRPDWAR
jgi:hypothetical protein